MMTVFSRTLRLIGFALFISIFIFCLSLFKLRIDLNFKKNISNHEKGWGLFLGVFMVIENITFWKFF